MGMDYYLVPNQESGCENDFPEGLSFFFEQVGGYYEFAEVSQVSRLLHIDLSLFQQISWEEDGEEGAGDEPTTIWHDLDAVTAVVNDLLAKLISQPDYHLQVVHNPNRESDLDEITSVLAGTGDDASKMQGLAEIMGQPLHHYPPDYGYLSEGRLIEDLRVLRQTLSCYKSSGVTQIKLLYM